MSSLSAVASGAWRILTYAVRIFIAVLLAVALFVFTHEYFLGRQDGQIETNDCRIHVVVTKDSVDAFSHQYVCNTASLDGKPMTTCSRVVTENGVCIAAYTYYDSH